MNRFVSVLVALAVATAPQAAFAWGATGHRLIGQAGAKHFSRDLPAFLLRPSSVEDLGELAREPDRWKGAGQPHDAMREGYHFVDLDDAARVLGGPRIDGLPATMKDYEAALAAAGVDRFDAGWLPYGLVDAQQQLTVYFGLWRVARAGEKYAKTSARRAWFRRDRERREALILREIGVYAHWLGDATQPMHASIHYNGWGKDAPNPNGYTNERIHSRFEGDFVRDNVTLAEVERMMRPVSTCEGPIAGCVASLVAESRDQIERLYALEKAGGLAAGDPRGDAFVAARLGLAASYMRDFVARAWADSATIKVGWSPIEVARVERGEIDPYESLRGRD